MPDLWTPATLQLTSAILLIAWLIDDLVGYPAALFKQIGHPVTWIGALISMLDRQLNRDTQSFWQRRLLGTLALGLILLPTVGAAIILQWTLIHHLPMPLACAILGLFSATLIAQKSLRDHVVAVVMGLHQTGLQGGRDAVAMIVGRDTTQLDEAGVSRAAIESLAENAADGIIAPACWCLLFGLPGLVFYKAVNTADSMIGHKSDRHHAFGWAAARLDDLINLPCSRLTALLFAAAALVTPNASAKQALVSIWRDAGKHQSPNAGWPEAAMAGALGFALGGPRSYDGEVIDLPTMGQGRADLTQQDITRSLVLFRRAMLVMLFLIGIICAAAQALQVDGSAL